MRFRTTLELGGKTATGIHVPDEVVDALAAGRRPAVKVTIGDHTYRSTIASRGDRYLLPVSAEHREAAGIAAGDTIDVDVVLDTEPRVVEAPADLVAALEPHPEARRFFDGLTASQQKVFVLSVESAKTEETRRRRVEKAVGMLREGRKR
jgi:Bacteriocin-protection, YdeI or OmpD-Associated/Domain of unknown function (DUF1905)